MKFFTGFLVFALAVPVFAETSALEQLKTAGGVDEAPAVEPAKGKPVDPKSRSRRTRHSGRGTDASRRRP